MEEKWKIIINSDGHYFISNYGNMKRDDYYFVNSVGAKCHREAKTYKPIFNKKNGYYSYKYRGNDGSSKSEYIHRLVAMHFIHNPNKELYDEINHIDCNKGNNHYSNLEWVDKKLNMKHASDNNLINKDSEKRKSQCKINQLKSINAMIKEVAEYDENGNLICVHDRYKKLNGNNCVHRLSYKGHYFRDVEIMKEKYGELPKTINVNRIEKIRNCKRKIYISTDKNGNQNYYNKLDELPIEREKLWKCFNHEIEDSKGRKWDIVNI